MKIIYFFLVILLILIYFFKIKKKLKKKLNLNFLTNIDINYISTMTILLYKEYNEPCLINLKDNKIFDYYIIFMKKYLKENDFKNYNNPIISIIIPVYNGKKYLIRSLLSIYAQSYKNIEIIYIDDNSKDNSTELIKNFQKIDKRIKLFINKENRGTLYSKSYGVTKSKGKYVMIMDQDDIYINKDLFLNILEISEKNDLDILQFKYNDYLSEKNAVLYDNKFSTYFNNIIIQPQLGDIKLYLNESLYKSFFLWDKLIKRKTYLKALNILGDKQWGINLVHREDHLMTFGLYKAAKNYMKINIFGYSHVSNQNQESKDFSGIIKGFKNISQIKREKMLLYQFQFSKFLYDNTKENKIEKNVAIRELLKIVGNTNFATKINEKYIKNLVTDVLNTYLKCNFIEKNEKKILLKFINIFNFLNYKIKYKFNPKTNIII